MTRYMLDTHTVSHLISEHPAVVRRLLAVPMAAVYLSSVTEGELLFGLARRPEAKRLHTAVWEFLRRVDVLPWDGGVAQRYGAARAAMERQGRTLAPLDLLIAAHGLHAGAVLVSNDRAFAQVDGLRLEDWTADVNVKVAYATHEPPLPRAGEGSGERETVMTFMIGGAWKSHDR